MVLWTGFCHGFVGFFQNRVVALILPMLIIDVRHVELLI